jgi:predicted dehydrogenase
MNQTLWLVGAGKMAQEYAKVLQGLGIDFVVIGRRASSAGQFRDVTGKEVHIGGIKSALETYGAPAQAIVAVNVEHLAEVGSALITHGTGRLLIEKPGGVDIDEINQLGVLAERHQAEVLLAYNRRFYASTCKAQDAIFKDGGAVSCTFEFTEWSHVIGPSIRGPGVKENWFLANSTHVVDLAFHLCGFPKEISTWVGGSLDWHPAAARFAGSGVTEKGVLFSYISDWEAPGRWGLEVLTRKARYIFRPMEKLYCTRIGSVAIEEIAIDDAIDKAYKPGLYQQTKAFLSGDQTSLCTIQEQVRHGQVYQKMAGYNLGYLTK